MTGGFGGGGGLGAGADVFVQQGGSLTIAAANLSGGTARGGSGGTTASGGSTINTAAAGLGLGGGIFVQGNSTITIDPTSAQVVVIGDAIADESGATIPAGVGGGSGGLALLVTGGGRLELTAANSYTRGTTVQGGSTLELAGAGTAGSGTITLAGGSTLQLDGGITVGAVAITNPSTIAVTGTNTIAGGLGGNSLLSGSGVLRLGGNSAGGTSIVVQPGLTLQLTGADILPSSEVVNLFGGTLDLNGFHQTVGNPTGSGTVLLNGATLTVAGSPPLFGVLGWDFTGPGAVEVESSLSLILRDALTAPVQLDPGSTLTLNAGVGSGGRIAFQPGGTETLVDLAPGTGLTAAITGLGDGDRIELAGLAIQGASFTSPGTVTISTGTGFYALTNVGTAAGAGAMFAVGIDHATGDAYIQLGGRSLNWTGAAGGDSGSASNWSDLTTPANPATTAPGASDSALFAGGPTTVTGTLAAGILDFSGNALWTLSGGADLSSLAGGIQVETTGVAGGLLVAQGSTIQDRASHAVDVISGVAGGNEAITVGGQWTSLGGLAIGVQGVADLLVPGGQLSLQSGPDGTSLALAEGAGSSAVLTTTGHGATVTTLGKVSLGAPDSTGSGGIGALEIEAGAQVTAMAPVGFNGVLADIGAASGSDGSSVTVAGTGSVWTVQGTVAVGDAGGGVLDVFGGGAVSAASLRVAVQAGHPGNIALSGAGSAVTLSGGLAVGVGGSGDLAISGGATMVASGADIGVNASSSGVIDLEGAGSELQITNSMTIGEGGAGVVVVGAGATLSVAGLLKTSGLGRLQLLGGLVDPTIYPNTGSTGSSGTFVATQEIQNTGTWFAAGSSITSLGTLILQTPVITNDGTVGHVGTLQVEGFGDLDVEAGTVDATQTVDFANGGQYGLLTIGTIGGFGAVIGDFNADAEILVQGASIASTSFDTGTDVLTLLDAGGAAIGALNVADVTGAGLEALETANAEGGLGAMACFAAGTRISTLRGDVAVEALREGDRVRLGSASPLPLAGEVGDLPVRWIGHRRVDCRRHPKPRTVWPVRIAAAAFGPGRPVRDLWLSPDHALFVDGVLIPVKHLINGSSVAQVPVDTITYYHVELPRHEVLLAEGLAAESYLETGGRRMFANGGGPVTLHPDFAARIWEAEACAPLIVIGPELERVRAMLGMQAVAAA